MSSMHKADDLDELFAAILSLNSVGECYDFFVDLCTVPELRAFAQRFHVAKMLLDGNVYSNIVAKTGASTATISRVNRSLSYGCGGYKMAIGRRKTQQQEDPKKEQSQQ